MAVTTATVVLTPEREREVQALLREFDLDGWLLYDFRGTNPISGALLGLPALTRRWFVLIPAIGRPVAVTHRIEQQPWSEWTGENRVYLSWQSLHEHLREILGGRGRIALEYSPEDAIPYVDRVPAGVLELVRSAGTDIASSADLVTALYSRWSDEGEASHRRASVILRDAAFGAFGWIGERLRSRETISEWGVRERILALCAEAGLDTEVDAVVAVNANAANPHYVPSRDRSATIGLSDLVLIDLWGKQGRDSIFADQTWMAYVGSTVPGEINRVWDAVRDARDAAIRFIGERWRSGRPIVGSEVDDEARSLIAARGFGDMFIHRTGHSIDRELHGSGPNIDNLETRDTRRLIPGIGFSIEPGIYLPGDFGIRSEIDVFMGVDGPDVTTPDPQAGIHRIIP